MQIYLARHGQSSWQVEQNDDWDSPLTDLGYTQARFLGQWLAYQMPPIYTAPEPYAAFKCQARQALNGLIAAAENSQGPILGAAHGGLLSTLLRLTVHSDAVSFWIYNAALHLIEWKRGRWHLVHLNLWDHLPPQLRTF